MTEIIKPTDENHWLDLRSEDITSTEAAALFGCSPYLTPFELWHRKANKTVVKIDPTERMLWGTRLQDAIAEGIASDNKWVVRRMDEYIRIPELRMGASFDFSIEEGIEDETKEGEAYLSRGLLEIKNVDALAFKEHWEVDKESENIEAPPHIEIQVQHQLAVADRDFAYIGALIGGNRVVLIRRARNDGIINSIKKKVAEFWHSIDIGQEPQPDLGSDAEFIAKLYGFASPGKIMDISQDAECLALAREYRDLGKEIKQRDKRRSEIKAHFLRRIGDAEKVKGNNYTISAGMVSPTHVEYDRDGYRSFKITWKRGAE